jgi:hypothetical protein
VSYGAKSAMKKYQSILSNIKEMQKHLQHDLPYERHAEFSNAGLHIPPLVGPLKEEEAIALAHWILEMTGE